MSVHAASAGQHERHGLSTVAVAVRHFLLWLLPIEKGTPDTWHTVGCAFGDLREDFFALLAIAGTVLTVGATLLILALLSPWLPVAIAALGALAVAWWRVLVAVRRLRRAVDEEAPR